VWLGQDASSDSDQAGGAVPEWQEAVTAAARPSSGTQIHAEGAASGRRWEFSLGSRKLAVSTVMHAGSRREAISVRCILHGCRKCVASARCPSQEELLGWLEAGLACPSGPAGQGQHMAQWPVTTTAK